MRNAAEKLDALTLETADPAVVVDLAEYKHRRSLSACRLASGRSLLGYELASEHGLYRYAAFGKTVLDTTTITQPLRWKGRWFSPVAGGIYDVRARQWAPEMAVFLSVRTAPGCREAPRRTERGLKGSPETFDFLGFTHICGKTKSGKFLLMRRTMRKRMCATLKELRIALMRRRHLAIPIQGAWLGRVVRGYFAYHAVPANVRALQAFRTQVERHWRHALSRRSQRGRANWETMRRLSQRWIPTPRILHPWPDDRFDIRTRGRSRVR